MFSPRKEAGPGEGNSSVGQGPGLGVKDCRDGEYSGLSQTPPWLTALWPSQGVVDLLPLGRKGYSVPKVGTIQVVSSPRGQVGRGGGRQPLGPTNLVCPAPRPYLTPTRLW